MKGERREGGGTWLASQKKWKSALGAVKRSAAIRVIPRLGKSEGRAVEKSRISLWNYINDYS